MRASAEKSSNVETVISTTSVIESEWNVAVVAGGEETAGEVAEGMIGIETMEVEDLIAEALDRDLRADGTQEIEDHSAEPR